MMKATLLFLIIISIFNFNPASADDSACITFYDELAKLPHTKLELTPKGFVSLWGGEYLKGCEIVFESHESIIEGGVVFQKFDSFIKLPGWTIDNKKCADGPGSSIVGINNAKHECLVYWSQEAWIDENSEHQQSDEIKLIVQCTKRN